ncbi:MAG: GNAT family N-acetyltransferase [Brumimicrobium sp.]
MNNTIVLKEIDTEEEMMETFDLLSILYADFTKEKYSSLLIEMIPNNYKQLVAIDGSKLVGVCGLWLSTKVWCGKYIELDNVVVSREYRSKGIGKLFTNYLNLKAVKEECNLMVCDVYTDNYKAQKFYSNEGFIPRGFHYIKPLNNKLQLEVQD